MPSHTHTRLHLSYLIYTYPVRACYAPNAWPTDSPLTVVCCVSQARLKNHMLRAIPNALTFTEVEFRALAVMGNFHEDHLYCPLYEQLDDDMVKQTYNKIDREKLPTPFIAPKSIRNRGKDDLLALMQWAYSRWCAGEVYLGWLTTGKNWGEVFFPPLSAYKPNILAMRRKCAGVGAAVVGAV